MANDPTVVRDLTFSIGGTDQTPHMEGTNLGVTTPVVEFNDASVNATRRDIGNKNWTATMEAFENDDGDFTAQIFSKVGDGTAYAIISRPGSAAIGVGNPQFDYTAHIASWGLNMTVNSAMRHSVTLAVDGDNVKTTA